ncbi:23S rRNA (uracil(1939)-C(5))-methyltransferase RlmD [Pseudaeromonas paramecii]|uniref:23S rRNA (Uracil(1939)-C(5))-methyltransferase RlmD n=1 Tax=Pseudaeromonas paramecii TaxID=2138166 RepID=A0ABP8QKC4_9GAMM
MITGHERRLQIDSLTDKGDGIGLLDGRQIYVTGALPGETVSVLLHGIKPRYAQGELQAVLQPHPARVANFCPHDSCGGCQLGMLDYPAQLDLKRQRLQASLAKRGIHTEVAPCLGMDVPLAYRNKALYAVRPGSQGAELGFFRKHSHDLVACDDCALQPSLVADLLVEVRAWLSACQIPPYDELQHTGVLRYLMLRDGRQSGEWMLVLVTLGEELPQVEDLLARLARFPALRSVVHNINPARGNRILGFDNRILQGDGVIEDELDGLRFSLSPLAFYQINPEQTRRLYQAALTLCGLTGQETVFDIYCGIGTISLFLARQAARVVGVELVPEAIEDARQNAARNGLAAKTEFFAGKAEEVVPALYRQGYRADVVVVDPPRKGCEPAVLQTMLAMAPRTLVYVSCDPDSLARDLAVLLSGGYRLEQVIPVDMFPHTLHVETVARLVRS